MSDVKFDILERAADKLASIGVDKELEAIMEQHANANPPYSKKELEEIRKRESNNLKNKREREKQEKEEREKQVLPTKTKEEKNTKKVVLGDGETANEMLTTAEAELKGGEGIDAGQYDDSNLDHNKLYTNNNPLYNSFRHDNRLDEYDANFWELEEDDAVEFLREKFKGTGFTFKQADTTTRYRGKAQPKGKTVIRPSFDAVRIIAPDGVSEEVIELDLTGIFGEGFGGWDAAKIEQYNKLTNFLDTHSTEKDVEEILKDDATRIDFLEQERIQNLEPTEEEYQAQLTEKELLSTDIFNEKKDIVYAAGTAAREVTLEYGGYEEAIEQARKQLIKENRDKAAVSNTAYVDPTIDEIKNKALFNLQNEERKYLRNDKYDAYLNELEDFDNWDDEWVLKRAKEEGVEQIGTSFAGKPIWDIEFQEKIRKEMKEKYYKLKVAGNDEQAKAILDYRANELALKSMTDKVQKSDAWKRFNQTNLYIQDLNHKYERAEKEVQLENGKIVPLHIWEQHTKDAAALQPIFDEFGEIMERANASISVLEDNSFKWNMIKRNYNDWDRFQEVLGYGFGNIGVTAIYGVPKLLSFGQSGGDDETIRWKEVVAKNRQSFRKDVEWDRAFEDGNFGRFMAQAATDQIPIYATLMTGNAGLGILGGSVFGDKWAEMTMEERASGGIINHPTWKKWFKSLGYGASEVVLDYYITVPILRDARRMMFAGKKKAFFDNSMEAYFKRNALKAGILSPALESVSESATQTTQNMIDGRPIFENLDHASFLGLTMGMGISYTGFTSGLVTSQFSDHKSYQAVRDNITELQKIYNTNSNLVTKIGLLEKRGLNTDQAYQELAENQARIDGLLDANEIIINRVNNNIKERLTPKAYREFLENEQRAEEIKEEAQKILDSSLDEKTKDKRLKNLLNNFNASLAASNYFKDNKSFGSRWAFVVNPTTQEGKDNLERLKEQARTELQNEGKQDPDEKNVLERARFVWAKEQARESNDSYKRTNLAKDYESFETVDEGADYIDSKIQEEIDEWNRIIQEGGEFVIIDGERVKITDITKNLEKERKMLTKSIKSGTTYGLTRINSLTSKSQAISIVESQAKAERFETRTHEGGHQVFWNALQSQNADVNFTAMADQIVDWTLNNNKEMFKRIMLRTGNGQQGAAEIVSVFLEEVADGQFDVRENKGFSNLWGLMSNDVITKTTGKDFEFDFSGETDVINFLVGLGKKIKDGTFTKADERAIRRSELMKSLVTKDKIEGVTTQFSKEASDTVQRIYEKKGADGAFDIIEQFKPITTRIARKYRDVPGYNEELIVSEIEIGERGILDLIRDYKPKSGVPLAAYINKFLPARSIEAANRILEEKFAQDVTEAKAVSTQETTEDILEKKEKRKEKIKKEEAESLRRKLKIKTNSAIYNKVKAAVIKTFGTKLPNVESSEFKKALQKAYRVELKKTIQDMMGTRVKFEEFLKQHGKDIYEKIDQSIINKRFKAFAVPVLDKNGKQLREKTPQGNAIFEKKKYNQGEWVSYFLSPNVGASTRGTRKDALAEALAEELAFDATMEVIQSPEVVDKRAGIALLTGQEQLNNEVAVIAKQINRNPLVQFSKESKMTGVEFMQQVYGLVDAIYNAESIENIFNLNTQRPKKGIVDKNGNKYNDKVVEFIWDQWVKGNIHANQELTAVNVLNKIPFKTIKENRGTAFEQYVINLGVEAAKKYAGLTMLGEWVMEGGVPDFFATIHGFALYAETKFGKARAGKTTINYVNYLTNEFRVDKVLEGNIDLVNESVNKALKNGAKDLVRKLKKEGIDLVDSETFVPLAVHQKINKGSLSDATVMVNGDFIAKLYANKEYPVYLIEIAGAGLYYMEGDPFITALAKELGIPKLEGKFPLKTRILAQSVKRNGVTIGYKYKLTSEPTIEAAMLDVKSPYTLTDSRTFDAVMQSDAVANLKIEEQAKNAQKIDKAIIKARSPQYSKESQGTTILDFDDTLATTKSLVKYTTPEGKTGTLNAEQYAKTYEDLLGKGYVFDFSDFNKVVKGKVAPLFKKALKLQKKFGSENMFVLTARPPAAAKPIHDFLKANGLNIPLKNITGLANSTSEAKALWIADKVAEGYNDFYFADDALQNVQAVKNMLDQFDVKSKVQQAKVQFSQEASTQFNDILEQTTKVESKKQFSDVQARMRGRKARFRSLIPPSAQDFMGLIYNFLPRGKKGEEAFKFFKQHLVDPFARGINELNASKQTAFNDLNNLFKEFKGIKKKLRKKVPKTQFTQDQAVRVYLWNKYGFEVPGISKRDLNTLNSFVENNSELKAFADKLSLISKRPEGYKGPNEYWIVENIQSDFLSDGAIGDVRSIFLQEWIENKNIIFSKENLNKIEAIYGSKFREALEDMLYRMETGSNRPRGANRLTNMYMNWVNNSVGSIMFFNLRSASLQTISATNYINWTDNNPLKAGMAIANQPQYWKDFVFIFNSDMLKQRRRGNQRGVNEAELMRAVVGSSNPIKAGIAYLLNKGFLPTQIADSFAIAAGGATFYRNRIKTYLKQGMPQKEAEAKAWLDFQEVTEVSQQSARPDLISQQQANPLGRLILAFQNTPMQYGRIMNKAIRDIVNNRGDMKTHISKIVYYGAIQAIIFNALQSAIWASLGDEDEEQFDKKKSRIVGGMIEGWLAAFGYGGKAIGTLKRTVEEYLKQRDKGWRADHAYTLLALTGFSPPIGSKLRKIYSSIKEEQFSGEIMMKRGFTLDNPIWKAVGYTIEGLTNIPFGAIAQDLYNLDNAMDARHEWLNRVALLLGWNTWDLGIKDPDLETLKLKVKEQKDQEKKIEKEEKKKEKERVEKVKKVNQVEKNKELQKKEREEGKKDIKCAAVNKSGKRCGKIVEGNASFCTIHEEVKQNKTGKKTQCKKTKSDGKRCKMKTSSASGYCYYHD